MYGYSYMNSYAHRTQRHSEAGSFMSCAASAGVSDQTEFLISRSHSPSARARRVFNVVLDSGHFRAGRSYRALINCKREKRELRPRGSQLKNPSLSMAGSYMQKAEFSIPLMDASGMVREAVLLPPCIGHVCLFSNVRTPGDCRALLPAEEKLRVRAGALRRSFMTQRILK
jgi:hypothetical protein